MDLMTALKISSSGMSAQRTWMNVLAENLANVNTTRTQEGGPYKRKTVIFETVPYASDFDELLANFIDDSLSEVEVSDIVEDGRDFKEVFDPGHPDADEKGIVLYPNISIVEEMVNMLTATRSYEANAAVIKSIRAMAMKTLELGR
ncbi:MAG: flagellar basal body rod protein FlgC [Deltaproteobacteria bacterium]|nr:MAG: flagellar basal body rod protein FlgC [Deltaproteobacteria bacterium]RLB09412.1 MAG: flagellar basal body rod protein FlgC [Deltaproteobacteria bacterium]